MPPPSQPPRRRRLLSVPAVYPCESIAPAPLLASLLSLAADLASRGAGDDAGGGGGSFPVLQRGVRQAVRVAGLLLAFLEEVQDALTAAESLPASALLGLTELHVALQKLRFLLTDCARRGARLWVLVNAGLAASELRAALGSVAAAMDVLPRRGVLDVSRDAGELARLVTDRSWRVVVWPDAGDERAARSVRSILEQFQRGVSPDAEDVRRVLARVGVRTWSDCSEEIAFLEDEMRVRMDGDDGGGGGSDVVLLNSLIAFLVYCRVVLFDLSSTDAGRQSASFVTASQTPTLAASVTKSRRLLTTFFYVVCTAGKCGSRSFVGLASYIFGSPARPARGLTGGSVREGWLRTTARARSTPSSCWSSGFFGRSEMRGSTPDARRHPRA